MKKQKDRLVELIGSKVCEEYSPNCDEYEPHTCEKCYANFCKVGDLADAIISDGWMRPPCKVGDKVYIIAEESGKIIECSVIGAWMCEGNCTVITDCGTIYNLSYGTTVFLTKEEAEAKLKEGVQGC